MKCFTSNSTRAFFINSMSNISLTSSWTWPGKVDLLPAIMEVDNWRSSFWISENEMRIRVGWGWRWNENRIGWDMDWDGNEDMDGDIDVMGLGWKPEYGNYRDGNEDWDMNGDGGGDILHGIRCPVRVLTFRETLSFAYMMMETTVSTNVIRFQYLKKSIYQLSIINVQRVKLIWLFSKIFPVEPMIS